MIIFDYSRGLALLSAFNLSIIWLLGFILPFFLFWMLFSSDFVYYYNLKFSIKRWNIHIWFHMRIFCEIYVHTQIIPHTNIEIYKEACVQRRAWIWIIFWFFYSHLFMNTKKPEIINTTLKRSKVLISSHSFIIYC